jgi:hypothetical protein
LPDLVNGRWFADGSEGISIVEQAHGWSPASPA